MSSTIKSIVSSIRNCTYIMVHGASLVPCDKVVQYRNNGNLEQVYVDRRMQTCGDVPPARVNGFVG